MWWPIHVWKDIHLHFQQGKFKLMEQKMLFQPQHKQWGGESRFPVGSKWEANRPTFPTITTLKNWKCWFSMTLRDPWVDPWKICIWVNTFGEVPLEITKIWTKQNEAKRPKNQLQTSSGLNIRKRNHTGYVDSRSKQNWLLPNYGNKCHQCYNEAKKQIVEKYTSFM